MSGLTFRLSRAPERPLDVRALTPAGLAGKSSYEIAKLVVGDDREPATVGDLFDVSGSGADSVRIESGNAVLDYIGADMDGGEVIVDGNAGIHAGRKMRGGKLTITGSAGHHLGSAMTGGTIFVGKSAGDQVGGLIAADRFGMAGGTIVVEGDIGARAGERMRRGTIIARGTTGEGAGTRMLGGTIWAEGGLGAHPGYMMRRGTLIGPSVAELLPTFVDCGRHDLIIVQIIARYLKETLGDKAPKPLGRFVKKIGGDMATIGRGEILLPAA